MAGGVAGLAQLARQHRSRRVEPLRHAPLVVVLPVVEEGSDPPALRILARRQGGARGRTDRGVDVETRETPSLRRELVERLGLDFRVAEAGKIAPAHVIDEHHHDIGPLSHGDPDRLAEDGLRVLRLRHPAIEGAGEPVEPLGVVRILGEVVAPPGILAV